MYEMIVRKPASRTSLLSAKHGVTKPTFEIFEDFMTGSLSAAPFGDPTTPVAMSPTLWQMWVLELLERVHTLGNYLHVKRQQSRGGDMP